MMTHRYQEYRDLARRLGVDAIALVPGPNFTRLMRKSFHSHERPLVLVIPVEAPVAAIVPNLELGSWALLDFEGEVFDWRDQVGYRGAFEALAGSSAARQPRRRGPGDARLRAPRARGGLPWTSGSRTPRRRSLAFGSGRRPKRWLRSMRAIAISEAALTEVLAEVQCRSDREGHRGAAHSGALLPTGPKISPSDPLSRRATTRHGPMPRPARTTRSCRATRSFSSTFGARWGGFAADITRTVFVGHATEEAQEVYDAVRPKSQSGRPRGCAARGDRP